MSSLNIWRERRDKYTKRRIELPVPEWKTTAEDGTETIPSFWAEELTESEVEHWRQVNDLRDQEGVNGVPRYGSSAGYLIGLALIDPDTGRKLFHQQQIVPEMKQVPKLIVDRMFKEVATLAGLLQKTVDDIGKNLESSPASDSGTTSQENIAAQ